VLDELLGLDQMLKVSARCSRSQMAGLPARFATLASLLLGVGKYGADELG
jgi:hypothetical protein